VDSRKEKAKTPNDSCAGDRVDAKKIQKGQESHLKIELISCNAKN